MDMEPRSGIAIEAGGGEYTVPLKSFLRMVLQRLWIIMLTAIVISGAVVGHGLMQKPVYQASSEILVGKKQGSDVVISPMEIQGLQQIAQTAVQAIDSRRVADAVIKKEGLDTTPGAVLSNMKVEQVASTQFIQVYYSDTNPDRARKVANALGEVSAQELSDINSKDITASVWEKAVKPGSPSAPRLVRNGILALLLGLLVGMGLAVLAEYLDDSWRFPEEVEEVSGVPAFGIIPKFEATKTRKKAARKGSR